MNKSWVFIFGLCFLTPYFSFAVSILEGSWNVEDGSKTVKVNEFSGSITLMTTSAYDNGAMVNWFFNYTLPRGRDVKIGEIIRGRVRSVDGFYGCVFEEHAKLQLESTGNLKIHYPLLTYHRESRSVRDGNGGYYHERIIDWNGWGWVETNYGFPLENYRVISSECVIDQKNWITDVLTKAPIPVP